MPGPFRQWRGAAAFINGWLDQDRAQQEMQLEFLESMVSTASTAEDIRGRQATERRAQALFPGELQQQQYQTTQMGIETQGMQRSAEQQAELDAIIADKFGLPSYEVFKYYVDAGKLEELKRMSEARRGLNVPEAEATLQSEQAQRDITAAQQEQARMGAYGGAGGPRAAGTAAALEQQYQRQLQQNRINLRTPQTQAQTEQEMFQLQPREARANIYATRKSAEAAMTRAQTPSVQREDIRRRAYMDLASTPEEGMKRWAEDIIYGAQVEAGRRMSMPQIQDNIEAIEMAIWRLEQPETTDAMATAMFGILMETNPTMFSGIKAGDAEQMTKDEIKELLMPRLLALNTLHKEADPPGRSYFELTEVEGEDKGEQFTQQAPPVFTMSHINTARDHLNTLGTNITGFSDDDIQRYSKNYLLKILNRYLPYQWEVIHQANKEPFLNRATEQDWQAVLETIRQLESEYGVGGIR